MEPSKKYWRGNRKLSCSRECAIQYWQRQRPERTRANNLRRDYGISSGVYRALEIAQQGECAICGRPETRRHPRTGTLLHLAVDHNHQTGKLRSLVCHSCNTGLGMFADNPLFLKEAARYLESYAQSD